MCDVAHPQYEVFTFTVGVVEAQPFRGHAGIADWMAHELEPWAEWHVEPAEVRDVGDRVLVRATVTARGKGSSVELDADAGMVFRSPRSRGAVGVAEAERRNETRGRPLEALARGEPPGVGTPQSSGCGFRAACVE